MSLLAAVFDYYGVQYRANARGEQSILCPVHDEKRKSCSVNLSEDVWHCHACGEKGGPLRLVVLKEEELSIAAAFKFLQKIAGDSGVDVPEASRARRKVPREAGFVPGYRRRFQTGRGSRPRFGS